MAIKVKNEKSHGFTIVELLVVIVVIGILAAITIVSYAGISNRAKIASIQSDLTNASKQINIFQVTNANGDYPTTINCAIPDSSTNKCIKSSGTNVYTYTPSNGTNPKTFVLDSTNGTIVYRVTNNSTPTQVAIGTPGSQGPLSPATVADDATVGTIAWSLTANAKVSDNLYSTAPNNYHEYPVDSEIKIVKSNGSIGSVNKSTGAWWPLTDSYVSYGSSSNLWGETWTPTDINDVDFGVVISKQDIYDLNYSHYLKATNFGFSIPLTATIDGITVDVERSYLNDGPMGSNLASVDYIRITVNYTN